MKASENLNEPREGGEGENSVSEREEERRRKREVSALKATAASPAEKEESYLTGKWERPEEREEEEATSLPLVAQHSLTLYDAADEASKWRKCTL